MIQNVVNKALPLANNPGTIAAFLEYLHSPDAPRFQVGDGVTFQKVNGRSWPLLILGIDGDDVDVICYDGNPHLVRVKMADLEVLRVVKIVEEDDGTVDMYRRLVGLEAQR
jgi:hypothetical protein